MSVCHQCQSARQPRDDVRRPASRGRRVSEIAGWVVSSATLVLLPKCPVCVAMYVGLLSGLSISVASASRVRTLLLVLSLSMLVCLALGRLWRFAATRTSRQTDN